MPHFLPYYHRQLALISLPLATVLYKWYPLSAVLPLATCRDTIAYGNCAPQAPLSVSHIVMYYRLNSFINVKTLDGNIVFIEIITHFHSFHSHWYSRGSTPFKKPKENGLVKMGQYCFSINCLKKFIAYILYQLPNNPQYSQGCLISLWLMNWGMTILNIYWLYVFVIQVSPYLLHYIISQDYKPRREVRMENVNVLEINIRSNSY